MDYCFCMLLFNTIKKSNVLRNIGASLIFKFVSVFLSFLYVPISRFYLGDLRYGVWATISSLVLWISLSDIGIGYGLRNRLTEALARNNIKEAQCLISTAYRIMLWICLLIFSLFLLVSNYFDLSHLFNIAVKGDNTNLALSITVGFVCINFWLSLVNNVLYSLQKASVPSGITVVNQIINISFIIIASYLTPVTLPLISIILGSSSFLTLVVANVWVFVKYKSLRPDWNLYEKKYVKSIGSFGIMLFISQICSIIMNGSDNILISKFFGAENVTAYTTAYKLFQVFIVINGIIITPMWSAFTLHNEKKDYIWMRLSLKRMNQTNILLSGGIILVAVFLPTISDLWLRHHLEYDPLMIGIMASYVIIMNFSCNYASLLNGVGDIKLSTIIALIQALLNIPLSILLSVFFDMGLSGIIGGTFCVTLLSFVILPLKVRKWFIDHEKQQDNLLC